MFFPYLNYLLNSKKKVKWKENQLYFEYYMAEKTVDEEMWLM